MEKLIHLPAVKEYDVDCFLAEIGAENHKDRVKEFLLEIYNEAYGEGHSDGFEEGEKQLTSSQLSDEISRIKCRMMDAEDALEDAESLLDNLTNE